MAEACEYLIRQPVLGFDTETRPSFTPRHTNSVALLQLSTYERCYLIRLCNVRLSNRMLSVLEHSDIVKIGAAVSGDIQGLSKLRKFTARGFVDLQNEVTSAGIENKSLRKMAGIVLGEKVSKAQRLSNWEAASLTDQQKMYAATDAWVCLRIYDALKAAE